MTINQRAKKALKEIELYSKQIAEEEKKLADEKSGKRLELENNISNLHAQIERGQDRAKDLETSITSGDATIETKLAEIGQKEQHMQTLIHDQQTAQTTMNACQRQLRDKYDAFGNNIPRVLDAIQRGPWKGERPIGPIGQYVKLRDRKWVDLVKIAVGNHMSTWIVTDAQDQKSLREILNANQKSVIVSHFSF